VNDAPVNVLPASVTAPPDTDQVIAGPPDHWADVLAHLALDLGFDTFVLMGQPEPQMLPKFIEEAAPRVRERVATARSLTGSRA